MKQLEFQIMNPDIPSTLEEEGFAKAGEEVEEEGKAKVVAKLLMKNISQLVQPKGLTKATYNAIIVRNTGTLKQIVGTKTNLSMMVLA